MGNRLVIWLSERRSLRAGSARSSTSSRTRTPRSRYRRNRPRISTRNRPRWRVSRVGSVRSSVIHPAPKPLSPGNECCICLEPMLTSDDGLASLYVSDCQHYFHRRCIERHIKFCKKDGRGSLCPLCRQPLVFRSKKAKKRCF